jgi:hypothetical protein
MVRPYLPASNDGHCMCVDVSRCPVYAITFRRGIFTRQGTRQQPVRVCTRRGALYILIHPLGLLQIHATRPSQQPPLWQKMERYFVAAVAVQCIAITNASWHGRQRSFTTHRSLSLYSWCEWTPLAGLMTFLAEAVDLPAGKWRVESIRRSSNPSVVCSESSSVLSQPHRVSA